MNSSSRRFRIPSLALLAALSIIAGPPSFAAEPNEIEICLEQLSSTDKAERRDGSYRLSQLGLKAKPAIPALIRALDDEDFQVWFNSIMALARIGPAASEAIPALIRQLETSRRRGGDQRQYRVAFALGSMGEAALPAIREALGSERSQTRAGAAKAITWIGPAAKDLTPLLLTNLGNENRGVREASAEGLGAIGKVAFPAIFGALKELDEKGRVAAARALGFAKDPDPEAVKQLAGACLGEEQPEVQAAMIATLSTWRLEPGRFLEILVPSLKSEDESLQQEAMSALILLERPAATSVPSLLALLTGDDLAVAQRAARTLGQLGPEAGAAAAALERLAQDEALSEESRGVFEDALKSVRP